MDSDDDAFLAGAADMARASSAFVSPPPRQARRRLAMPPRAKDRPVRGPDRAAWMMSSPEPEPRGPDDVIDLVDVVASSPYETAIKAVMDLIENVDKARRSSSSSSESAAHREGRGQIAAGFVKKRKAYHSTKRPARDPAKRRRRAVCTVNSMQTSVDQLRTCSAAGCRASSLGDLSHSTVLASIVSHVSKTLRQRQEELLAHARLFVQAGRLTIHGKPCCQLCFSAYHGFSRSSLNNYIKKAKAGQVYVKPVHKVNVDAQLCQFQAEEWLRGTYTSCGDYMPDDLSVQMPVYTIRELHRWYEREMLAIHQVPYKYPRFGDLLRKRFPYLKCRKHKRFSQCKLCNEIDVAITKTQDPFKRSDLMARKDMHRAKIKNEKGKYYKHRAKGRDVRKSAMSIILDDMDLAKTSAPQQVKRLHHPSAVQGFRRFR